jgi:hypothetical protein
MTNNLEQLTSVSQTISFALSELTHHTLTNLVRPLDDATIGATAGPTTPSIGFHVWHSGRWADIVQAHLCAVAADLAPPSTADDQLWCATVGPPASAAMTSAPATSPQA